MERLRIHNCDLHIHRRGDPGALWAGKDDHKALARNVQKLVLHMLEELLLPRLDPAHEETVIPAIDIALDMSSGDLTVAVPLARTTLRAHVANAIQTGLATMPDPVADVAQAPVSDALPNINETPGNQPRQNDLPTDIYLLLSRFGATGILTRALSLLEDKSLRRLLHSLDPQTDLPSEPDPSRMATGAVGSTTVVSPDLTETVKLIRAIHDLALIWQARAAGDPQQDPQQDVGKVKLPTIRTAGKLANDRRFPLGQLPGDVPAKETRLPARNGENTAKVLPDAIHSSHLPRRPVAQPFLDGQPSQILAPGRYDLASALPFLLLGPLSQSHVLAALALAKSSLHTLQSMAYTLALVSLPPDEPGASHDAGQKQSGARFAAGSGAFSGSDLAQAAHRSDMARQLSEAACAAALIPTLSPVMPLPCVADNDKLVVFDPSGLYPICNGTPRRLSKLLAESGLALALSNPSAKLWDAVTRAGLTAFAAGPPVRGETATKVRAPNGWVGRTNMSVPIDAAMRARLAQATGAADQATDIWGGLCNRTALIAAPASDPVTDEFVAWAALITGFALADIGWALAARDPASWKDPDPILVQRRFGDYSGRLDIGRDRAIITLPMGRRFSDLRDAGLLQPIHDVPWWPGRIIEFTGG